MIVLDASALLEVLLRRPDGPAIETRIFKAAETVHAPHLIDLEVAHVLRRYATSGKAEPARCEAALSDFLDFDLHRHSHELFLPRIWALRANLTAYDAAYVALAEALDAPLLSRDKRLAAAAGHYARIEIV